jgi:hypothetical protein
VSFHVQASSSISREPGPAEGGEEAVEGEEEEGGDGGSDGETPFPEEPSCDDAEDGPVPLTDEITGLDGSVGGGGAPPSIDDSDVRASTCASDAMP